MSENLKILVPLTVEEFNTLDILLHQARVREYVPMGSRVARARQRIARSRPPGYPQMIKALHDAEGEPA